MAVVTEKDIIEVLRDGPMCTEELLHKLEIEPGGGELVPAIQNLMEKGIVKRHSTFVYELNTKVCQLCGAAFTGDASLLNCEGIEVPVCDACVISVHQFCNINP